MNNAPRLKLSKKTIVIGIIFIIVCISSFIVWDSLKIKNNEKPAISKHINVASTNAPAKIDTSDSNGQTIQKYDDVRYIFPESKLIDKLDLSNKEDVIPTLTFNLKTVWPESAKMPKGISPKQIMDNAMNPGLGIRDIHSSGITGAGVNVAIIDQPIYLDHPEFTGKIVSYYDTGCKSASSMHGPAVTSLLIGEKIGTAPDAKVYYAAAPSWLADASYYAKALDWIVEQSDKLPKDQKIRVVSVSAAPSGPGSPFDKNNDLWDKSVAKAESKGILILDCTENHGFIGPCYYNSKDQENVSQCIPGFPGISEWKTRPNHILVPASPRTTAEEYTKGDFGYQYTGRGGLSWSIPYCAGVLALGWQERPELTYKEMTKILLNSAYLKDGNKIIDPKEFIKQVKEYK